MQRLKKALSLLLCCAMLFGVLPFSAFATEPATETPEIEEEFFEEEIIEVTAPAIDDSNPITPINNYPEYPDEGAVKVSKTGTGIDFQSSGIAQVEISASGVPIQKGADLIIMLDTSSSMNSNKVTGTSKTRLQVLQESLVQLVNQLRTPNDNNEYLDVRVAIADFNGYYDEKTGTAYDQDENDYLGSASYDQDSKAQVYTGDKKLGIGAFVQARDLPASYTLSYTSGTNYDYGFDAIYQLGAAVKAANKANGVERDLYVIFMSDGAAFQWNYYHSRNSQANWGKWITGAYTTESQVKNAVYCDTHYYYYDFVDHDGDGMINEHRMANAIKGDPNTKYKVIRKNNTGLTNIFTATNQTNIYEAYGLGATMFTINFDAKTDGSVSVTDIDKALASTASDQTGTTQYYYKVTTAAQLEDAFSTIGSEIAYAANNARYVDQMGGLYDLQMKTATYKVDGANKTITPKIEILSYDIYTRADFEANKCTESQIGDRKGTYKVLETVTFAADGSAAYSDKIGSGVNILGADGIIRAQSFYYNTNSTGVAIAGISIPTGTNSDGTTSGSTNVLPGETFYWNMGTITTSELAMRYHVYLTGSMEGVREAGSYATNEYANLYYNNYAGNPCVKETVSPVLPWQDANVSVAFYLVDENGNIIVNQTSGETGSFANKIAVTNPIVLETLMLNGTDEVIKAADVAAYLPEGYTLMNGEATYTINVKSNGDGSWDVNDTVKNGTTYVTNYDPANPSAYTKGDASNGTYDYTHTVVWFAVVWQIQAVPDVVVIDYGLPVDISVLSNDMFGEHGILSSIGTLTSEDYTTNLITGFGSNYEGDFGSATVDPNTGKVRYTPADMMMNGYEKFAYAVKYSGTTMPGYYYSSVTVIPATTIYYEDNFLTYSVWDSASKTQKPGETWNTEGTATGATQAEDRPGKVSMTDANNIYGYDAANLGMTNYSLGQSRWIHVDAATYAKAEFTFTGTGFDVISMTSNDTGLITAQVYNQNDVLVKSTAVDTYYGYTTTHYYVTYTYTKDGVWVETECVAFTGDPKNGYTTKDPVLPETANVGATIKGWKSVNTLTREDGAVYQVPVLKVENLEYGTYKVVLTATYAEFFDHVSEEKNGYDLYLDAVRVYNPANNGVINNNNGDSFSSDTTIKDAYLADGEAWPTYYELRNLIIEAGSFSMTAGETVIEGLMFVDGSDKLGSAFISDYISYGPNNEVYLAPGQRVAFKLRSDRNIANVHIGIKSADGKTGTYTITNVAESAKEGTSLKAGDSYNTKTFTMNTSTDMYYDLGTWKGDIIVISNVGNEGILSLTNIKVTHTEGNQIKTVDAPVYMTPDAAMLTLRTINNNTLEQAPEQVEPETNVPETTDPETTEPETEDETTAPETEPEQTKPAPGGSDVKVVIKIIKKLIGRIFG